MLHKTNHFHNFYSHDVFNSPKLTLQIMMVEGFRAGMEFKRVTENGSNEIIYSYIEP